MMSDCVCRVPSCMSSVSSVVILLILAALSTSCSQGGRLLGGGQGRATTDSSGSDDVASRPGDGEVDGDSDTDTGSPDDACDHPQLSVPDRDTDGRGDSHASALERCLPIQGFVPSALADDCDDSDPAIHSGAADVCDGHDNDCDGRIDEDGVALTLWPDSDGDGYGDDGAAVTPEAHCTAPAGLVTNHTDCDDTRADVHPGAADECNERDDDCDGRVDEDAVHLSLWPDRDGDGSGDDSAASSPTSSCSPMAGFVDNHADCNDASDDAYPGALEVCNDRDDDCDGVIDDSVTRLILWRDADGDGFGDQTGTPVPSCEAKTGFVANARDCDDTSSEVGPGRVEVCNDLDDDCSGDVDDSPADLVTWYADRDNDGHGTLAFVALSCTAPTGFSPFHDDCDDRAPTIKPGAAEICDGFDNNCDGTRDEGVLNACGVCGAPPVEVCGDGLDDDCDGTIDEADAGCVCDGRTDQPCYGGPPGTRGVGVCRGSIMDCECPGGAQFCSDGVWGACAGQILPSPEVCDGVDNDCDGETDEELRNACGQCSGEIPAEVCDRVDNDCDGEIDEGLRLLCGLCPGQQGPEVCGDGLDNNCDGEIDESCACTAMQQACYLGPQQTRGVGTCHDGVMECYTDTRGPCRGYSLPELEICDGLDNDCDGRVDVGPNGCSVCGESPESCDNIDNDCDGVVDEGLRNSCGQCLDQVQPEENGGPPLCNGLDDDCDGMTDEGLVNACGTCALTCYSEHDTPSEATVEPGTALIIAPDDPANPTSMVGVTLAKTSYIPPYLWAANHDGDTLSRFNTVTKREEGRYWVADNPSRTGVDLDGNVWVVGRNDGRVTKVLVDPTTCPDRNGNGVVDTSSAADLTPINSAGNPLADECVVFSSVINSARPGARGVAAGPDGRVWIGYSASGGGVQSIDPHTFAVGPYVSSDGAPTYRADGGGVFQPVLSSGGAAVLADTGNVYGVVVDSNGYLYTSSYKRDQLARFDTRTGKWDMVLQGLACGTYGIAIDALNRVWTGGWPNGRGVGMFDPRTMKHTCFGVPAGFTPTPGGTTSVSLSGDAGCGAPNLCVTGVAAEPKTGNIWASFYDVGYTGRLILDENNLAASTWRFIGTTKNADGSALVGADLRGVGFDKDGYAWTLGLGSKRVFKLDPATNARAIDLPNGAEVGTGGHYTYSDFTGSTVLSFTAPKSLWKYTFQTGFAAAQVDAVRWKAHVPVGTVAELRIRALSREGVQQSSWYPDVSAQGEAHFVPYPPGAATDRFAVAPGRMVGERFEVEVRLSTSNKDIRPIVNWVELLWQRP